MVWPGNYKKNLRVALPKGYLSGQSLEPLQGMRYGLATVGNSGCGPIAVYNAMCYLGKPISFSKILRELEVYAAPFGSLLGTFPFALAIFFRRRKISYRMRWSLRKLNKAEAGIIAYWTKRPLLGGAHLVFFERMADGRFRIHNRYSNRGTSYVYKSLNEFTKQSRVIIGYTLSTTE